MVHLRSSSSTHDKKSALADGGSLPGSADIPATLLEALYRAAHQQEIKGITYLQTDGTEVFQTYADLCQDAEYILSGLRQYGLQAGDKVILQVEENHDYLPAFWACLLGGIIAVPISIAPGYTQPNITTAKLQNAWELCEHPLIVASATLTPSLLALEEMLDMKHLRVESVASLRASGHTQTEVIWHSCQPDDIMLILFTSGSTGLAKGVTLTHRNILSIARGFTWLEGLSPQEITFNWMPLDHVGGLITFHLRDVFLGCQQVHASPRTVLQAPLTWLDCLDRYHATCTWAPNFAFSMINEQAAKLADGHWNLSALHYILNAGEAIVPKTARRFLELLRPYGLASTAIHPSWGMSETSSGVTFSSAFSLETTSDEDRFVDVGTLIPEVRVRIVDSHDQLLEEGEMGRIQVQGPTVTGGYYRNSELNREVFTADGWFDTGDLGMLQAGRLTVTGRSKNIIIINGLNYYSHEIEAVVEELAGVEATFTAACAVREPASNTDALAVFYHSHYTQETEILAQLNQIRKRVIQAIGIAPAYLLPLEKQAIPKTESGKIQRARLARLFEEGTFETLQQRFTPDQHSPRNTPDPATWTALEKQLVATWQQILSVPNIALEDNFFELGGHSLALMQLLSRIREISGVTLTPRIVFDAPTVVDLARQIEALQKMTPETQAPPLVPVSRKKFLPLSFTQQRLWFLDQFRPGDTAYTNCSAFRLNGQLDIIALEHSLQEITRRHEVLRTTFVERDNQPGLLIHAEMQIELPLIALDAQTVEEQEHAVCELIQREIDQPFDLVQGPLARYRLFRLKPDEHILVTIISHIITDGWSLGIFNQEIAQLYGAFKQRNPSPLPDLLLQFADYAYWQHQWFKGEIQQHELAYWKEHLQGVPTLLELPTDHPRQAIQAGWIALHHFEFPLELTRKLHALSQQENTTLFMLLLAAFNVLLYRYTCQTDVVVGTVIANRPSKQLEALIGFFANTLALRTKLAESLTFREVLSEVRKVALGAYTHSEAPFDQVVNSLRLEQNLSHAPLVQVAFFLQDEQMYRPHFGDLQVTPFPFLPFPFRSGSARFDLLLEMTETGAGLQGSFEYDSELFEAETIARLAGHWQTLLESIVAAPQLAISQLPLLTATEQRQLLVDWNATALPFPEHICLHRLFEEQSARTPLALAVRFEDQQLTYGELNQQANQLAHYLQGLGVGPDVLVGVYMERSLEMLVALLGVLKAGGAYVPLDPKFPQERLSFQLDDAQITILLTQERLRARMAVLPQHVLHLDTQWPEVALQPDGNPTSHVLPTNLAYMIYTSGSTGKPKGVQVLQRGVVNFLLSMQQQPGLTQDDVLLAITTISFDIAALELFLPLLVGAQVVIASQEVVADSTRLASLLATSGATVMQATPATWRLLLDGGWSGLPQLKALCGGEALPRELASQLLAHTRELWNLYGPTETTIWSTIAQVKAEDGAVTIGHPIANTHIYILDKCLQPVPAGITGDLYIGGAGLARGYFQRPDLTNERFLPDPFSQDPEQRMYITGDLARYQPDGNIEYLGRSDFQVKVHGYRIELGEIEAALMQHPLAHACVVTTIAGDNGNKQLAAYLILQAEENPGVEEFRQFLQRTLPEYMVPAFFLFLKEFPLTPNGKVDRLALPVPDDSRPALTQAYVAPQTPEEHMLAAIWSDVLHIEHVGIYDNFFALGGDSLLSMTILAKSHKQGLNFSLQELFQHPRISDLSRILRRSEVVTTSNREPLKTGSLTTSELEMGEVPLLPGEGWQLTNLRNPHQFNYPLLFIVNQPLDWQILEQTMRYLIHHHDALRLRFRKEGSTWTQFLLDPDQEELIPMTRVDLSMYSEEEQLEEFKKRGAQAQATLHLCHGPIARVIYFDMGPGKAGRLFWFLNHIVCDHISSTILLEDFLSIYHQLAAQGSICSFPQETASFKSWADCLQAYIQSSAMQEELEHYWLKLPWDQVKPLPADFPENASIDSFKASRNVQVELSQEETTMLLRQVPNAERQLLDVFLAMLSETFATWTGSPWLPIYVSDHGREPLQADMDLIRTVGFLSWKRLYLLEWQESAPNLAVQAIKRQRDATPNQGKGFEPFYYLSDQAEKIRALPECEVLFNYVGQTASLVVSSDIFQMSYEPIDGGIDGDDRREPPTCIQVVGRVINERLNLTWDYSENLYQRSTIEKLAQSGLETLRTFIHALARNQFV
jgi:amino acid adenylation domain-containing protein/non-ribosomal peptide synthase protein (TIGR01720 family)